MGLNNYMSLDIGGKVRGLKFNIGLFKCLEQIIGSDPLEYKAEGSSFSEIMPYAINITHAALLSNCFSKKEAPDFTEDDVSDWVNELSGHEVTEIINRFNGIFKQPKATANGEVSKDTQPGSAVDV